MIGGLTTLYIGGITSMLVFFGMLFSIFRFASKEYGKAKEKGYNPYIPAMWGAMIGFAVGVFVVTMWLAILRFLGFPPEVYVCIFFLGDVEQCCKSFFGDEEKCCRFLFGVEKCKDIYR